MDKDPPAARGLPSLPRHSALGAGHVSCISSVHQIPQFCSWFYLSTSVNSENCTLIPFGIFPFLQSFVHCGYERKLLRFLNKHRMCYALNYRHSPISGLGFPNHSCALLSISRTSVMGSSITWKTWMNLFLKVTYSNKDTNTIYMRSIRPLPVLTNQVKALKCIRLIQLPTVTSSLHVLIQAWKL